MSGADLAFSSAAELGRRIAHRQISPVEVAQGQLERIARLDPGLRSHITVTAERALADAGRAEAEIASGRWLGPLHGVPLGLKDLFDTAGIRTTAGSRILADHVPAREAVASKRLAAAGTVLLGKHNMHEFAYGTTSTNPHYGACCNPWDRERVPGGSSGGSGTALAAGLCHAALGSDTGGSIRIPASVCGIVGLKPTFGRVSRHGVWPLAWSLDHVGPMARTVADVALLLGAVAGADPEDAWTAGEPVPDFGRDLEAGVQGLRVGVPRRMFFDDLEPAVGAAVEEAIALLGRLGARVVAVEIPRIESAYTAFHAILATEASAVHEPWMRSRPGDYGELVRQALELGYFIPAVDYVHARRMQALLRGELDQALRHADVLVTPTLPRTALRIGESVSREPQLAWNRFLVPFSLAGLPAISLPCGFDGAGLPIGLQLAGRAFDEATVLRAARAYERANDWHLRRPPGVE